MKVVELPVQDCMFACLTKPPGSRRVQRQELVYEFEGLIPISLDQVQISFASTDSGVIACACPKTVVHPLRHDAERVVPKSLPTWIASHDSENLRHRLNLLNGTMQSHVRMNRRELTSKVACVALILASVFFYFGARDRASSLNIRSEQVRSDITGLYESVLPRTKPGITQPNAIRFSTLMNQLSATRTGMAVTTDPQAVVQLAEIMQLWPAESQAQLRSITVDRTGVRIEASIPDNELATNMLEHLQSNGLLTVVSHQMTPSSDLVELRVQLVRNEASGAEHEG